MNFLGWRNNGSAASSARPDISNGDPTRSASSRTSPKSAQDVIRRLTRLCQGPDAHPFLRPLGNTFAHFAEANGTGNADLLPAAMVEALAAAAEFLAASETPARHLEFALNAHKEQAATQRFIKDLEEVTPSESLDAWRQDSQDFVNRCQEVWELHAYFVFLDVKGDRVLFEQTAHQLCRALECSMRSFVSCLAHTRPWVEDALLALSRRELCPLLERLHANALRQWRAAWQERIQQVPEKLSFLDEAHQESRFWDTYFTHVFKIAWPDFVEALESFYILGRCPVDIVRRLRLRVDPLKNHQVSRSTWREILENYGRIWEVIDALLEEVLQGIGEHIYRAEPLRSLRRSPSEANASFEVRQESSGSASAGDLQTSATADPSSSTASPGSQPSMAPPIREAPSQWSRPKAWFPFAHSADDGEISIPTPHDLRLRQGTAPDNSDNSAADKQQTVAWDDFVTRLCEIRDRPWWAAAPGKAANREENGDAGQPLTEEPLRVAALRAVASNVAHTHRALIFRVVSGDLQQNKPIIELPKPQESTASTAKDENYESASPPLMPALVVTANGTHFSGVTKFGRSSSRRTLLPDFPMTELIASRSHFNVVYEQETDRYFLMDAGSKWGTFVKIGSSVTLSCGDWIRVGGVEFIIRYCGGGCGCRKRHAHYRLHSLRLLREHQERCGSSGSAMQESCSSRQQALPPSTMPEAEAQSPLKEASSARDLLEVGAATMQRNHQSMPSLSEGYGSPGRRRPRSHRGFPGGIDTGASEEVGTFSRASSSSVGPQEGFRDADRDSSEDEDRSATLQDELLLLLSSRRPRGWTASSARLCQQGALRSAGNPLRPAWPPPGQGGGMFSASSAEETDRLKPPPQSTPVPISPLELDFISGPRMGEKIVLCDRVCTLGRGEGNTIQVNDSQLASVSRLHCIFECSGNRWHMRDNGSTNGTWRRLSCILEPSEPIPLHSGVSIQAGVHEFLVEEAEMRRWWVPSTAFASFEELCEQENHEGQVIGRESDTAGAGYGSSARSDGRDPSRTEKRGSSSEARAGNRSDD
mmetsp:Transcript_21655/g.40168  ORF Transcript_21655/g.40168 Transcript_21655/m.40168 type:complete len:1046 (+) Transcript_21655:40-3177(+)